MQVQTTPLYLSLFLNAAKYYACSPVIVSIGGKKRKSRKDVGKITHFFVIRIVSRILYDMTHHDAMIFLSLFYYSSEQRWNGASRP